MRSLVYPSFQVPYLGYAKNAGFNPSSYYDLWDGFTIPRSAGAIPNPLVADTVGSHDTSGVHASYYIDLANGFVVPDVLQGQWLKSPSTLSRALGRALYTRMQLSFDGVGGESSGTYIGWYSSDMLTRESGFQLRHLTTANTTQIQTVYDAATASFVNIGDIVMLDNTTHHLISVLLTRGCLHFAKGGNFTDWTLHTAERYTSRASLHRSTGLIGGFDSDRWEEKIRAQGIAKPSAFWANDFVASITVPVTNGTIGSMQANGNGFTLAVGGIYTAGAFRFQFRKVDANNYVYINIAPNGANNLLQLIEVVAGVSTTRVNTTCVAGDVISVQRGRNGANPFRFLRNTTGFNWTPAAALTGTGYEVLNTGDGTINYLAEEPRVPTNAELLAYLNALILGAALP